MSSMYLLRFQASARSSRVSERTRRNLPSRLITCTRLGSGMGDETNDRAAGMIPPPSKTTITARAIALTQNDGDRPRRSARRRNSSRSKRNQNAAGNALQQNFASSCLFLRLRAPVSARKRHQCQACRLQAAFQRFLSAAGASQLASQIMARQMVNVLCAGLGTGMRYGLR